MYLPDHLIDRGAIYNRDPVRESLPSMRVNGIQRRRGTLITDVVIEGNICPFASKDTAQRASYPTRPSRNDGLLSVQ